LKVLHVIPSIGPARGGPSVVIRTMARSQADRGIEVHVATTDDNGPGRIEKSTLMGERQVKYFTFRRQTRFYTFSLPLTTWLWKHAQDYDVIHIHALFSYPSIAAAVCAKRAGVPYLVRPLGTLNKWGMYHRRPWLKRLSFWLVESNVLRWAAGVQYTSTQEELEARRLGVEHVSYVIPNPVELPGEPAPPGVFRSEHQCLIGKTVVIFLSRLDAKKGLDLLLPAFARIRVRHPEAILVVAGDGNPTFVHGLKEQSRQLGLDKGIMWVGFLAGETKRSALADADVFVLPSYSENFGVAVVEAMGAGLPVVVSDQVGVQRQVIEAKAGIVVECSTEQLELALCTLIGDATARARMGKNARRLAQQFAPPEVALHLATTYAEIRSNYLQHVAT
jgi:glycosyltransferase involved in cell wall biosynthesis